MSEDNSTFANFIEGIRTSGKYILGGTLGSVCLILILIVTAQLTLGGIIIDVTAFNSSGEKVVSDSVSVVEQNIIGQRSGDTPSTVTDSTQSRTAVPYPNRTTKEWDRELWPHQGDPGHRAVPVEDEIFSTQIVERELMEEINRYRAANGFETLSYSHTVASTARSHSYEMHSKDFFSHITPSGEKPWQRFPDDKVCARHYGENLAQTAVGAETIAANNEVTTIKTEEGAANVIIELWKNSNTHNALLRSELPDTGGVGVYIAPTQEEGEYSLYATFNTCRYFDNPIPQDYEPSPYLTDSNSTSE